MPGLKLRGFISISLGLRTMLDYLGAFKKMESLLETDEKVLLEVELTLLLETTKRLEEELSAAVKSSRGSQK